jgi:hypothetical protein
MFKEKIMKYSLVSRAVALALSLTSISSAWSNGDGKSPEQLGTVSCPTSCEPAVQTQFTRSVALLHSFWFNEGGNPAEALVQYERSQVRDPNRLRSLLAAGQAVEQTNNPDKAKMFYTRVTQLVGTADSRPEFKVVREYLAKN